MPKIHIEHGLNERQLEMLNNVKKKVKAHWRPITISIFAGITYIIMRSKPCPLWGGVESLPNVGVTNTASLFFRSPQSVNITNVLVRDGRGHPGWPVQNLDTNQVFFSQKQAADAFGIGEGTLSSHLKGKFPDANGLHFQRVNLTPLS